jgi:hypothetical protein
MHVVELDFDDVLDTGLEATFLSLRRRGARRTRDQNASRQSRRCQGAEYQLQVAHFHPLFAASAFLREFVITRDLEKRRLEDTVGNVAVRWQSRISWTPGFPVSERTDFSQSGAVL